MSLMKEKLAAILRGQILDEDSAAEALREILSGNVAPVQIAAFLTAIQMRGIALPELAGFHRTLRSAGTTVDLHEDNLIDVCGTGGDGKGTINISTLSAFVLAGTGTKVAKHGNSSATSGCGSSDILAHLGVQFTADENTLRKNVADANICYLHAPLFQPLLKAVAPIRSEIGFRTFFNLLGPLLNPAQPRFQFIGVADPSVLRLYRYFLEVSGTKFTLVHSRDGYDEISLTSAVDVVTERGAETYYPEDLGFETISVDELIGGSRVAEGAEIFLRILRNDAGVAKAQSDVVVANAAFAMQSVRPEVEFAECKDAAEDSLRSGAALRAFETLRG